MLAWWKMMESWKVRCRVGYGFRTSTTLSVTIVTGYELKVSKP